jgi:glutathionyl-hydroquinone reductase
MNNTSNIKEKRAEIKAISQAVKNLVNEGVYKTVNDGLKSVYSHGEKREFKTFDQWEKIGMHVKRGEKAVYLWGKQTTKTITENGTEKEIKYFPLIALFSDLQVYNPQNNK